MTPNSAPAIPIDAILFSVVHRIANEGQTTFLILAATEADAQQITRSILALSGSLLAPDDVIYFPGFVQAGVFRFESARKVLAHRIGALHKLSTHFPRVVVSSACGISRVAPHTSWIQQNTLTLRINQEHDIDELAAHLRRYDYSFSERVEDVGEFTVRGGILDCWSPGQKFPTRLEFFGDTLEKIRVFRKGDQRSFDVLETLPILPLREFVWPKTEASDETLHALNKYILAQGMAGRHRTEILENLRYGITFPGIDDLASVFSKHLFPPLHALLQELANEHSKNLTTLVCSSHESLEYEVDEMSRLYNTSVAAQHQKQQVAALLGTVFPDFQFLKSAVKVHNPSESEFALPDHVASTLQAVERKRFAERMGALSRLLEAKQIDHILVLFRSTDTFLEMQSLLAKYFRISQINSNSLAVPQFHPSLLSTRATSALRFSDHFSAALGSTEGLFFEPHNKTLVLSEMWMHGAHHFHSIESFTESETEQASREASIALMATQFGDFSEGDLVVHVQHGIARFKGLTTVSVGSSSADFLALEYAGGDKVYVPVNKMNLIQRYVGGNKNDDSLLDALKSTAWEKRKAKAKADAEKLAKELLEHQAKQATTPGHAFSLIGEEYVDFESAFPYDETDDQLKAVREIMSDMSKSKAMDRLLVGDVGFGKTEVAMRAAYRAVLDGKQVAWLVPTTVLAHQHARSLRERFAEFGAKICLLDRSLSGKSEQELLNTISSGAQDIIIGTHRLLSKDITFQNLGLLVVDEEHRFGVLQKERIKQISYGIDTLTMTATPIPRTLQMAMIGLRDLSLLTTPPKARLAVKTFISPYDESIIRDAIANELSRGGQVFFVHNRVEDLRSVQEYIHKVVPTAKICVGHGQMSQKDLDKTIIDFIDQKFNLLLCTTIIESGIDMPNVNTIIIQDADQFGLAQLYQLRGRVGRRSSRGYAFFLMSEGIDEDGEGMRRLNILRDHQDLGSGFIIASHDLEMRGAGNILGDEQSGRVSDVGLETYTQMLDDTIRSLGGVKVRSAAKESEITIPTSYQIPENYIQNSKERLRVYRRFFATNSEESLVALIAECEDRFGPLPPSVHGLADVSRIRRWLVRINAAALAVASDFAEVRMHPDIFQPTEDGSNEVLVKRILTICNMPENRIRLTPDGRILLPVPSRSFLPDPSKGFALLKRFLSQLANETEATHK
jgi:transcription-repair coupling factor (superfamily II helicase)